MPARMVFDLVFAALTFTVGLQLLRLFSAGLVFTLRDAHGFSTIETGLAALVVFASAFLWAPVVRAAGPRRVLLGLIAVMALARIAEQFTTSPTADLALAALGVAAFLPLPALALGLPGGGADPARGQWRMGLLLGLALDTAIKGAFGTLDPSWQQGWTAAVVGAGAPIALLALVARAARSAPEIQGADAGLPMGVSLTALFSVGPLLFLEMLLFQNVAQLTAITGWEQWAILAWVVAANSAGVHAARWAMTRSLAPAAMLAAATALAVSAGWLAAAAASPEPASLAAVAMLAGHVAAALLIAGAPMRPSTGPAGWAARQIIAGGAGGVALITLLFTYYAQYDIDLGLPRESITVAAALLVAAPALLAFRAGPWRVAPSASMRYAPALAAAMLLAPLALALARDEPNAPEPGGWPLRVMTYNIHQGFDTSGRLGMEALAQAVEAEAPDIVAIQEINRGWVIAGSVDTLLWLSSRLDMPYVYGPAADAVFGNAVLSRYPITAAERRPMPNNDDLVMDRSYLWAEIDTGAGPLRVIAAHFHHVADEGPLRTPQTEEVLRRWGGADRTVLMGDLNAQPGWPELAELEASGMVDAFAASGSAGQQFTARSDNLFERIDYIWASPDLQASAYSARVTQGVRPLAGRRHPVAAVALPVSGVTPARPTRPPPSSRLANVQLPTPSPRRYRSANASTLTVTQSSPVGRRRLRE